MRRHTKAGWAPSVRAHPAVSYIVHIPLVKRISR